MVEQTDAPVAHADVTAEELRERFEREVTEWADRGPIIGDVSAEDARRWQLQGTTLWTVTVKFESPSPSLPVVLVRVPTRRGSVQRWARAFEWYDALMTYRTRADALRNRGGVLVTRETMAGL